ncbi:unnamed protein product [Rotaria sp. Silwood1]|nr:unnamed protein product [Rotaria sp. Silwood1]CAF3346490.1 unnamed protein product [Rotaria sp. Silwood1]CAF3354860.1 unnamed protein product [Rotaria sp. Silwood1]CAF4507417.1 unnamed protein product [Rotaria sp. Silwood1]CAF4680855.1 unnamed protein product [Rotaria sp. Silwood1]
MEQQKQLTTMFSIEKSFYLNKSIKSHPKRRFIADSIQKLNDDEKMSDDIFALTMYIFDRFISTYSLSINNHDCQLIALSCYNLAKKLRTNTSINNENEQMSWIYLNENYSDKEIFNTEQLIVETLDWDLSMVVPHDYIHLIFQSILLNEIEQAKIHLHVHILLSIGICELNTLTILPSVLCCACIKAAIKGLCIINHHQIDELLLKIIHCNKFDLIHTQRIIDQLFQCCLQEIFPSPRRRCLVPIDTNNQTNTSPRVK